MGMLFDRLVRAGMRRGFKRGLVGGNQVWLAVGAVALGARLLRRMAAPGKGVTVIERLSPGQALIIRHLQPGE
jgi:hypothetical protein